jgi:DNA polymerase-3 subunit epsilon
MKILLLSEGDEPVTGLGFAVIDFETTGLFAGGNDRVVELAVVHVDPKGQITGSWQTLVNPERDLGVQRIHGIQSWEILAAPKFAQIVPSLIELMDGRVLVAHNASFDIRFLLAELKRCGYGGPEEPYITSLCTMKLAGDYLPGGGRTLADCCAAFDIEIHGAHHAQSDAMATAELLAEYLEIDGDEEVFIDAVAHASDHRWPLLLEQIVSPAESAGLWLARGVSAEPAPASFLQRITVQLPASNGPAAEQDYLALLDRCLIDRHLAVHEADALVAIAADLGLDRADCERLNNEYFHSLVLAGWADGVLAPDEIADLTAVAELLGLPRETLEAAQRPPAIDLLVSAALLLTPIVAGLVPLFRLMPGDAIVLTGEMSQPRELWDLELEARGFVPKPAVTKKVALVVAADPDSLSGKARKARQYGIPVVNEDGLRRLLEI